MDNWLYAFFIAPTLLAAANAGFGGISQYKLLRDMPRIATERDMHRFKTFAAVQMYQALFQLAAFGVILITAGIAVTAGGWSGQKVLLCMAPMIGVSVAGISIKLLESRIKAMPVNDMYREEFTHVIRTWMHKPFPDW